jgi:hypothetical protein
MKLRQFGLRVEIVVSLALLLAVKLDPVWLVLGGGAVGLLLGTRL